MSPSSVPIDDSLLSKNLALVPNEEVVDWLALREEWVTTQISLPQLAKKYGIKFKRIRDVANRNGWGDHAREYQASLEDALMKRRADKVQAVVDRLAVIDDQVIDLSEKAIDFLDTLIDDTMQERNGSLERDKLSVRDAIINVKLAVDTVKSAYGNIRLAGGKSTSTIGLVVVPEVPPDELKRIEDEFKFLQSRDVTNASEQ